MVEGSSTSLWWRLVHLSSNSIQTAIHLFIDLFLSLDWQAKYDMMLQYVYITVLPVWLLSWHHVEKNCVVDFFSHIWQDFKHNVIKQRLVLQPKNTFKIPVNCVFTGSLRTDLSCVSWLCFLH